MARTRFLDFKFWSILLYQGNVERSGMGGMRENIWANWNGGGRGERQSCGIRGREGKSILEIFGIV